VELVNEGGAAAEVFVEVCDAARAQPARTTTAKAAAALDQPKGFTGFMQDNSTREAAAKIKRQQ